MFLNKLTNLIFDGEMQANVSNDFNCLNVYMKLTICNYIIIYRLRSFCCNYYEGHYKSLGLDFTIMVTTSYNGSVISFRKYNIINSVQNCKLINNLIKF